MRIGMDAVLLGAAAPDKALRAVATGAGSSRRAHESETAEGWPSPKLRGGTLPRRLALLLAPGLIAGLADDLVGFGLST